MPIAPNAAFRICAPAKLIVAAREADLPGFEGPCTKQAVANGVDNLVAISADDAKIDGTANFDASLPCIRRPPESSTAHALMLGYQGDAEDNGAMIAFNNRLTAVRSDDRHLVLTIEGDTRTEISCSLLVKRSRDTAPGTSPEG